MSMLNLHVTHSVLALTGERRFDSSISVAVLKDKLYRITGTAPHSMRLELYDDAGALMGYLVESKDEQGNESTLEMYGAYDFCRLHVVDLAPAALNAIADVSTVEKYVMADEDYDKVRDSVRNFKRMNKLGEYALDPEEEEKKKKKEKDEDEQLAKWRETIKIGDRARIIPDNPKDLSRRGEVRFLGKTEFAAGIWVGVRLDEPLGKNNGTNKGKRYFDCEEKHGVFVKPEKVETGDFPELGFDDDEDLIE